VHRAQFAALFIVASVVASSAPAVAAQVDCGVYEGVVCEGAFTDELDLVADPERVEDALLRLTATRGNQVAIVIVSDSRGRAPTRFAADLGNAWGVGDAARDDGIVVLISVDERYTAVATGPGVTVNEEVAAAVARPFFSDGDFEGGILAIIGFLDQSLSGEFIDPGAGSGVDVPGITLILAFGAFIIGAIGIWWRISHNRAKEKEIKRKRELLVDADLEGLEPSGHELPRYQDYAFSPQSGISPQLDTRLALASLRGMSAVPPRDPGDAALALWSNGLIVVLDKDRLLAETREPLELRSSSERPLLENAVQQAAIDALAVPTSRDDEFRVRRDELQSLISSLRPHRIAAARRRLGDAMAAELVETSLGWAGSTAAGRRFLDSGPALDPTAAIDASIAEIDAAYRVATAKASRLETLYASLPESTARPAVAAALADVADDPDRAIEEYEELRQRLEAEGDILASDGLDIPAISALLLMNNDAGNSGEFIEAYGYHRDHGREPALAVEYALAGLMGSQEIANIRSEAKRLDLPISITAALLRRRDDGPEVYKQLRDELAGHVDTASSRTIAGILAMSLEPSQALRRWLAARTALESLGLQGSYADVAAAFGASDPRGPRIFALAYVAQRAALADSSIDDADRFAPELAHEGTSGKTDTWTGKPLPATFGSFDPFTFFYYHWVITRGHAGSYGWEPVYRNTSWSDDRSSWWGGGGGFGSAGGSSWGGSSWSGGSFGGFGGGGGFSGGGGGGW